MDREMNETMLSVLSLTSTFHRMEPSRKQQGIHLALKKRGFYSLLMHHRGPLEKQLETLQAPYCHVEEGLRQRTVQ